MNCSSSKTVQFSLQLWLGVKPTKPAGKMRLTGAKTCTVARLSARVHVHILGVARPLCSGLHSRFFFDPASELGDCCVDAGFVPASAAIAPADHSCQVHMSAIRTGQRTAWVSLTQDTESGTRVGKEVLRMCCVGHNIYYLRQGGYVICWLVKL